MKLFFFNADELSVVKSTVDYHFGRVVEYETPKGRVQTIGHVNHGLIVCDKQEECLLESGEVFPLSEVDNLKAWEMPGSNHWPPPSISGLMKYFF